MFSNKLSNAIKDLKSPETSIYITFEVIFIALYTWSIIGINDAGYGVWVIMAASAFRNIIAAGILFITTRKTSDFLSDSLLIKILATISGLSTIFIILYGYEDKNIWLLLAIVSIAHSAVFSLRIVGVSMIFPKAQSGDGKNTKLAIILLLAPIILATVTTLSGFLASFNIMLPLIISVVLCFSIILLPKYKKIINSLKQETPLHMLEKPCKECLALFTFSAISSSIGLIIKWVIVPLYLWEELGRDPKKLGIALSLIILVGLVAKSIKDESKSENISNHSFLMFGYFLNVIAILIWSNTDSLTIIGLMIALKTIGSSIYSYGYLSKLESINPDSYKTNLRLHQVVSYGFAGIVFFIIAFWADNIMNNINYFLFISVIILIITAICYQIFCWKFERVTTSAQSDIR